MNKALLTSCLKGYPVRVVRSHKVRGGVGGPGGRALLGPIRQPVVRTRTRARALPAGGPAVRRGAACSGFRVPQQRKERLAGGARRTTTSMWCACRGGAT